MIRQHLLKPLAVFLLASSTLAACVPNLGARPELTPPNAYATARSFDAPTGPWPSAQWWKAYGDPQLDALIDEAIAGSPDLKMAEARMRQAAAVATQVGANQWPQLSADGHVGPLRQSLNQGFHRNSNRCCLMAGTRKAASPRISITNWTCSAKTARPLRRRGRMRARLNWT